MLKNNQIHSTILIGHWFVTVLGDMKHIRPVVCRKTLRHISPKDLFWNSWRMKTSGEPADSGSPGKESLKPRRMKMRIKRF